MLRSSLENTKEAHLAVLGNFKHQEDVKLHGQLPDYDDFQGCDLGQEDISHHVAHGNYANFRKPPWRILKHHLFSANVPKKIPRRLKSIAGNEERAISNKRECLGDWLKSP